MKYIIGTFLIIGLLTGGGIVAKDAITDYVDSRGSGLDQISFNDVSDETILGASCSNTFPTSTNSYSSGNCIPSAWANALETKIGIDGSSDTDSLDYLVKAHSQPTTLTVSGTSTLSSTTTVAGLTITGNTSSTGSTFLVPTPTASSSAATKNYVDISVAGGGAVADTSTAGIGIFSSLSELIAGTATSSYSAITYNLFPQNRYFDATPSATTTVPVTETDGDLNAGFIGQDQNYTWTGTQTWNGTQTFGTATTLSTTTIDSDGTLTINGNTSISTSTPASDSGIPSKYYVDDQNESGWIVYATSTASSTTAEVSMDAEVIDRSGTYGKVKEVEVRFSGLMTATWEMYQDFDGTSYGKVYVNGNAVSGTELTSTDDSYTKYATLATPDYPLNPGDFVQLYVKCPDSDGTTGEQCYFKNFRLHYEEIATTTKYDVRCNQSLNNSDCP